jgi:hypothetical protein
VTTDLVVGVVTLAVAGLAMAPVEVAMATAARSLLREEDIIMLLVVVMQGTEAGVATRAMAMVALAETAIFTTRNVLTSDYFLNDHEFFGHRSMTISIQMVVGHLGGSKT